VFSKSTECTQGCHVVAIMLLYVELLLDTNDCTFPNKYSNSRKGTSKKENVSLCIQGAPRYVNVCKSRVYVYVFTYVYVTP
jgi:hypothetical protein